MRLLWMVAVAILSLNCGPTLEEECTEDSDCETVEGSGNTDTAQATTSSSGTATSTNAGSPSGPTGTQTSNNTGSATASKTETQTSTQTATQTNTSGETNTGGNGCSSDKECRSDEVCGKYKTGMENICLRKCPLGVPLNDCDEGEFCRKMVQSSPTAMPKGVCTPESEQ